MFDKIMKYFRAYGISVLLICDFHAICKLEKGIVKASKDKT